MPKFKPTFTHKLTYQWFISIICSDTCLKNAIKSNLNVFLYHVKKYMDSLCSPFFGPREKYASYRKDRFKINWTYKPFVILHLTNCSLHFLT